MERIAWFLILCDDRSAAIRNNQLYENRIIITFS